MKREDIAESIVYLDHKNLLLFVEKHYSKNSKKRGGKLNTNSFIERNINALYRLDTRTLDIGIARTTQFIEKLNFRYWIAPMVSMIVTLYLLVLDYFKECPEIQIVIFSAVTWIIYKMIMNNIKKRTTIIYFKELLINAREARLRNIKHICLCNDKKQ